MSSLPVRLWQWQRLESGGEGRHEEWRLLIVDRHQPVDLRRDTHLEDKQPSTVHVTLHALTTRHHAHHLSLFLQTGNYVSTVLCIHSS